MRKYIVLMTICGAFYLGACSNTRETVRANPQSDTYEPLRQKGSEGYYNVPGSQNREVREDIRNDRPIDIKND